MRHSTVFTIALVLLSSQALAKPAKKGADKGADAKGPSMDTGPDPAETEKSEKGPYAPKGETGQAAETQSVKVDAAEVVKARARDKRIVFGNVLIGFGKAPVAGPNLPETGNATSFTFMAGIRYEFTPVISAMFRLPWSTASVDTNGTKQGSQALGTPELLGEYRLALGPLTHLPVFFGFGIPIAQGDPNPTTTDVSGARQAGVNAIADAMSGYRDGELFGPKRLPLILGARIEYERKALTLHAGNRFIFGIDLGTNIQNARDPSNAGNYEAKKLAIRNVTSAGVAYQLLDKPELFVGLESWIVYKAVDAIEFKSDANATPPSRLQFVFEPQVGARFGKVSPSLGFIIPIGGRLADSGAKGLELHVDVAF